MEAHLATLPEDSQEAVELRERITETAESVHSRQVTMVMALAELVRGGKLSDFEGLIVSTSLRTMRESGRFPFTKPPLLREHRLYQADWLLRYYGFSASELLDEQTPNFNPYLDPKCNWALRHPELFPVEVNRAPYQMLLRVPGIGVRSAQRIVAARRTCSLDATGLRKLGVVMKRAQYFITCGGKRPSGLDITQDTMLAALLSEQARGRLETAMAASDAAQPRQLSLFEHPVLAKEELQKCLTGEL